MQKFYQLIHSEKYRIMSTSGIAAQITNPYSNDPILTIPSKTTGTTEEIIATREWVNNDYARFASNKDTSVPTNSWTAGASATVTVAGTYMVISSALFNNNNGNQAISVSIGSSTYYQTFYNYTHGQSNTLTLMLIAGISANTVIRTNIWSQVARTVNNNIVAIRII